MTDREKLNEVVRRAANACLPSNTEEFHLRMFVTHLLGSGVSVQKHGRWIVGIVKPGCCTPGGDDPWICSECGRIESWLLNKPKTKYCPNCGAKMDMEG